jgi:beta-mannosidase
MINPMSNQQRRFAAISAQLNAPKDTNNNIARSVLNLDKKWLFKQSGHDAIVPSLLPTARFPTEIYSDLLHHTINPDPFRGMNEQDVQWVAEKIWVYQISFNTPKSALSARKAVLVFEGLDTFATVKLNGTEVLRTENMFIRYEADVRKLLQPDADNILEIIFENAANKADAVMKSLPDHKWGTMGGDPKRTAVRKAQYHFVSAQNSFEN